MASPKTPNVRLTYTEHQGHHIRAVRNLEKGVLVFSDHVPIVNDKSPWALTRQVLSDVALQERIRPLFLRKFDDCYHAMVQWDAADENELKEIMSSTDAVPEHIKDIYGTMCTYPIRNEEGMGLYPLASFVNHSCDPNCSLAVYGQSLGFKSKRKIKKGEEITFAYFGLACAGSDALLAQLRRSVLKREFGFDCVCSVCTSM